MFKFILELIVFYFLYKFVFEFIIPIYNATKQVKQKMNEMQEKMGKTSQKSNATPNKSAEKTGFSDQLSSEYTDYEEVK